MGWKFLSAENLPEFRRRIESVRQDSKRQFGSLEPVQMLAHLTRSIEASLGDHPVKDGSSFFSRHIMRRLAFETSMPWPKGKIKAPEMFFPPNPGTLDAERTRLLAALNRFVKEASANPDRTTRHPFFGNFTMRYWQRAHGKHFNHHFAQFGA